MEDMQKLKQDETKRETENENSSALQPEKYQHVTDLYDKIMEIRKSTNYSIDELTQAEEKYKSAVLENLEGWIKKIIITEPKFKAYNMNTSLMALKPVDGVHEFSDKVKGQAEPECEYGTFDDVRNKMYYEILRALDNSNGYDPHKGAPKTYFDRTRLVSYVCDDHRGHTHISKGLRNKRAEIQRALNQYGYDEDFTISTCTIPVQKIAHIAGVKPSTVKMIQQAYSAITVSYDNPDENLENIANPEAESVESMAIKNVEIAQFRDFLKNCPLLTFYQKTFLFQKYNNNMTDQEIAQRLKDPEYCKRIGYTGKPTATEVNKQINLAELNIKSSFQMGRSKSKKKSPIVLADRKKFYEQVSKEDLSKLLDEDEDYDE